MDAGEGVVEQFFGPEKVMEVGTRKLFAGGAVTIGVNGVGVGGKFLVADINSFVGIITFKAVLPVFHSYLAGIKGAVSGESGWGDAIEHINAQRNGSQDIGGFEA